MKNILAIFNENSKKENILVILILAVFSVLCFFIPSFSALPILNYATILLVAVLCILILIWKFIFHKILIDSFFILLVLFNLAIIISNIFNKDATHIITYATLSGMSFCLYQLFIEKKYRSLIHHILLIAFFCFSIYFIFYYRSALLDFSLQRIGDKFDNLNTVGYYFLYAFAISLTLFNYKRPFSYLYLLLSAVFIFLLYRTGSRSALILAIICIFVFPFYVFRRKKVFIAIIIDATVLVLGIVSVVILDRLFGVNVFSRLGEFFDALNGEGTDYSSANRIELVIQSFQLFLRKPIFGWGNNVFAIYSSERLFAHNNITELLCDFGLFGFLPFEIIIISSYIGIKKSRTFSNTTSLSLLLLICFFGIQFFYVNSQLKFDWIVVSLIASEKTLLLNSRNESKRIKSYFELSI